MEDNNQVTTPPAPTTQPAPTDGQNSGDEQEVQQIQQVWLQREKRVTTFYGDDPQEAYLFEDEVRRAWTSIPRTSTRQRVDVILDSIGPDVRDELGCLDPSIRRDPEELLKELLRVFGDNRDPTEILHALLSTRQRAGEAIRAYSHRVKRNFDMLIKRQTALAQAPDSDQLLRDHFCRSVHDRVLSKVLEQELHRNPSTTFKDIRETAIRWGRDDHLAIPMVNAASASHTSSTLPHAYPVSSHTPSALPYAHPVPSQTPSALSHAQSAIPHTPSTQASSAAPPAPIVSGLEMLMTQLIEKVDQLASSNRQPRGGNRGRLVCYNCNKPGHMKRDCQLPRQNHRSGNGNSSSQ